MARIDFPDTASVVTITLTHVAQYLGEMRITGQKNPSSPFVQGFYDRWLMRQKGLLSATFIGPEELEFRHPDKVADMLRGLNGVCIGPAVITRDGGKTTGLSSQVYAFASHFGSMTPNWGCPACPMAIVIDRQQQYPPSDPGVVSINRILSANDVMAIEVYARGGNMPISLQVNDTKCGVIAFWTGSRK